MTSKIIWSFCAFLLFCAFISLGVWQWHRAEEKRLLLNAFSTHTQKSELEIKNLKNTQKLADLRYFPIKLRGYYDNTQHFLLDNKFYKHQLGYEVLTPFFPEGDNKSILVNRGWIPRNYADKIALTRSKLNISNGQKIIHGIIYIPLGKPFLLKQMPIIDKPTWPLIVEAIQIDRFALQAKRNFYPAIIWLDKKEPDGFVRNWHPVVMLPEQHIAYAVQWLALAMTVLIIYLILIIKKN